MEREVRYRGAVIARFEWVGIRSQDEDSAVAAVETCFDAWPDKHVPAYLRLQLIARVLSDAVRTPLSIIPGSAELPRDKDLENAIEATYLHARGLRKLERRYERELRAKREALVAANAKHDAEMAAVIADGSRTKLSDQRDLAILSLQAQVRELQAEMARMKVEHGAALEKAQAEAEKMRMEANRIGDEAALIWDDADKYKAELAALRGAAMAYADHHLDTGPAADKAERELRAALAKAGGK